jgi:hypothetical protein
MMLHPPVPWTTSAFFDPDLPNFDSQLIEDPDSAGDGWADEESSFWDQMIFPL